MCGTGAGSRRSSEANLTSSRRGGDEIGSPHTRTNVEAALNTLVGLVTFWEHWPNFFLEHAAALLRLIGRQAAACGEMKAENKK